MAIARPEDLTIHRWRTLAIDRDSLPATVVYSIGETDKRTTTDGVIDRTFTLRLEHRYEADGDHPSVTADAPDEQIEPLILWARQQILGDATLAALLIDIEETGKQWDTIDGSSRPLIAVGHDFDLTYESTEADVAFPSIRSQILDRVEIVLNVGV